MSDPEYDAIVVGSGPAGGWAAKTLGERGIRVLLLEAGPLLPGDHRVDRADHRAGRQLIQSLCSAYEPSTSALFVDDLDNPYRVEDGTAFHWFRGRQAGGRLHLWAGVSLRMSDREFTGVSTSACGAERRAWPIRYRQLAPYYARVERLIRVSGGGERSPSAPAPGIRDVRPLTAGERRLADAVRRTWHQRQVLTSRTAQSQAGDLLAAALRTGKVRLRCDAVVSRLKLDPAGRRATGVLFVDRVTGVVHRATASAVVLCASAVESVRILLNSRSPHHADGLGNRTGQLGRYFFDHLVGPAVSGTVPGLDRRPEPLPEPGFVPVCHIPDFTDIQREVRPGFGVTVYSPETLPLSSRSARWAREADGTPFRMWACGEVLPRADNQVQLSDAADAWGVPQANIRLRYGTAEKELAERQAAAMKEMADAADFSVAEIVGEAAVPGTSVHELGGAAMGDDPARSVVDAGNRLWEAPNVVVADGASFTTGGWQNPTLTIMALAARAGDLLADAARSGPLRTTTA
ncbi:GMC oxidoreductase [Streptomyces umbrinus]